MLLYFISDQSKATFHVNGTQRCEMERLKLQTFDESLNLYLFVPFSRIIFAKLNLSDQLKATLHVNGTQRCEMERLKLQTFDESFMIDLTFNIILT